MRVCLPEGEDEGALGLPGSSAPIFTPSRRLFRHALRGAEPRSLGKQGKTISDETTLGIANVVGTVAGGSAPKDTDQDGMPDDWESKNGLDPADPSDRNGDADKDGYTNLEEHINALVP